jgi:hypothetical protein
VPAPFIEVQPGGGGGHRARLARIHGLVAALVLVGRFMRDVWRQGHLAVARQQVQHLALEFELEEIAVPAAHRGRERAIGESDAAPLLQRLGRAHLGERAVRIEHPLDQHLDLAAAVLAPVQARLDHPCVVDDQHVAGKQQVDDVGKAPVVQLPVRVHVQQPARGAFGRGVLRDQLRRELVVEIREAHARIIGGAPL